MQTSFKSKEYPSLAAVAAQFLGEAGASVDRAVFGVAGPVTDGQARATNLPWVITEAGLQGALGVHEVKLLNDLETTAYGVPNLPPGDLFALNDTPIQSGTKAVLAPGTRPGEAVLFYQATSTSCPPKAGTPILVRPACWSWRCSAI